jgi:hypothetical protein
MKTTHASTTHCKIVAQLASSHNVANDGALSRAPAVPVQRKPHVCEGPPGLHHLNRWQLISRGSWG